MYIQEGIDKDDELQANFDQKVRHIMSKLN